MKHRYRVNEIKLGFSESEDLLLKKCAEKLGLNKEDISDFEIYRKSYDLRKGKAGRVYSADATTAKSVKSHFAKEIPISGYEYNIPNFSDKKLSPVVCGFGPSGMFAALLLARAGLCPLILERGKSVDERIKDVDLFFSSGKLNTESNVQFGEGGAGTFSDGKLNTLQKDKNYRGRFVLSEFVKSGADKDILYDSKPHIGTDVIRCCVKNIREEILSLGGKILFNTKLIRCDIKNGKICGIYAENGNEEKYIPCDSLFLAIGHSARDTVRSLYAQGIKMEKKPFSVGVRIEHRREDIDKTQFGEYADFIAESADYKLSYKTKSGRILYTFCMCPGGIVVPATSENKKVVTNGMSNRKRDEINSNSALLCSVDTDEFENVTDAISFQEKLEEKAFILGGKAYKAPCQKVGDFINGKVSQAFGKIKPSYSIGTKFCDLSQIFPDYISETLKEGIMGMGKLLPGFDDEDAVLTAVESRSTAPFRITRDENYNSSVIGLYPIGEGAGYAGGIMTSAIDGMKCAEKYFEVISNM